MVEAHVQRAGLTVAGILARFVEERALPGTGIDAGRFWEGAAAILARFAPENVALLAERDRLQGEIDRWYEGGAGRAADAGTREAFLRSIGYLVDPPEPFTIRTTGVDPEVAAIAGPQLVVPVLNARFALNAANARWGSLYDALYGTDALGPPPAAGGYDRARGAEVIATARRFLDETVPLAGGSWLDWTGGAPVLVDPAQLVGQREGGFLLRHNGLHIELLIDRDHPIGRDDPAGLADVVLESAVTTICDLEDSIAAVDAEDKVAAYGNWLGLMRGDLTETIDKGGARITRVLAPDREWTATDGTALVLPGRALLFVRNVGLLMTTPAVRLPDGAEAPEGILDALVTVLIGLHDLKRTEGPRNSRTGAIYVVKPKLHGPAEAAFTDRLFAAVEELLGLAPATVKLGLMDEERRTSANLAACIAALGDRIAFINTGFLDRTGDEIHTAMKAGPVVRKGAIKASGWLTAYEQRNVAIGLACGLAGRAQIGKGMWAMPDRMADMLAQKHAHPQAGASTAWVPSPTAAALHALHYHRIDVAARQRALADEAPAPLAPLLAPPLADGQNWAPDEIAEEVDTNVQGILGYVVRWIDQGVGCSKVPDLNDVGLMEDRATLRISAQHLANWLLHGIVTRETVEASFARMAGRVDGQNAGDPAYRPLAGRDGSIALDAARALVFEGVTQPSGYTEPLLHAFRARRKGEG